LMQFGTESKYMKIKLVPVGEVGEMNEVLDFVVGLSYELYMLAFELRFCSIILFLSYH